MESLYLLPITNQQSNILQDLDPLRPLSKPVIEYFHKYGEERTSRMEFEIIFALDITLEHNENVTVMKLDTIVI